MQGKILVAYASKGGSTAEVANEIGKVLNAQGLTVDVRQVNTVTDVSSYQAVIIGSAIRMGGWLSAAKKFVKTHQQTLSKIPTAYFAVCLSLKDDTEENRREAAKYLDAVRAIVEPKAVGLFAGKMDYRMLSFLDRLISEKMAKAPEGDFRNWDAIRDWAANLEATLV
jgi:menaquinone-dependent protoporphyrinogen oxidase